MENVPLGIGVLAPMRWLLRRPGLACQRVHLVEVAEAGQGVNNMSRLLQAGDQASRCGSTGHGRCEAIGTTRSTEARVANLGKYTATAAMLF
jgi:hypothetical protein